MRLGRWGGFIVAALLALPVCVEAQPPTPTPMVFYHRDGGIRPIKTPLPTHVPVCAVNDRSIGLCPDLEIGGGGNVETDAGATREVDHLEEEVATVASASEVTTSGTIPAGSLLERCLVRTNATVNTSGDDTYQVGVEGTPDLFGESVSGTVGETNAADDRFPSDVPIYVATEIVLTPMPVGGVEQTFSDNDGRVRVSCFYRTYGAPIE